MAYNPDPDYPTKPPNPYAHDSSNPEKAPKPYQEEPSAPSLSSSFSSPYSSPSSSSPPRPSAPSKFFGEDLENNYDSQGNFHVNNPYLPGEQQDSLLKPPKEAGGEREKEKEKEKEVDLRKWMAFDENLSKNGKACRFCLDDGNQKDMIAPCLCAGGSQWVHRSCLEQWQSTSLSAYLKCPNCLFTYKADPTQDPSYRRATWRFRGYLFLDFLGFVLAWQLIIFAIFGVLVGMGYLEEGTGFGQVYLWSLVFSLFGIGVVGSVVGVCYFCCFKDEEENRAPDRYGGRGGNCPVIVCVNGNGNSCDCCFYCCTGDCHHSGGGGGCSNCNCNSNDCKGEALLIIFIIFVVIGVFVLFYVGSTFMARRYNTRSKKLLFLASAKEERVADLSLVRADERDRMEVLRCKML